MAEINRGYQLLTKWDDHIAQMVVKNGDFHHPMDSHHQLSGDSWMYPYQRTPMGNPYISPIYIYIPI